MRVNALIILLIASVGTVTSFSSVQSISAQGLSEHGLRVETVAEDLIVPWEIAFAPDGRIFFTERTGNVRLIENGDVQRAPMLTLDVGGAEGGLLGMALDPDFENNRFVYLYYTYREFLSTYNRVSKFVESENKLTEETVLIDKIPGSAIHDGGRLRFGPDGMLYVTTGDAANSQLSQDLNSLAGKILRINSDGSTPEDNPFESSLIFSFGHRNPQGLDWDPDTGVLVSSEHGPSGERGFAHDEINIIKKGNNYGWPQIIGDETKPGMVAPVFHTGNEAWAPSGASFYDGNKIPSLNGKFLVANLRGTHLHVFDINTETETVESHQRLFSGDFGRLRSVSVGPDGYVYLLTSNRDGRGSPAPNDDRILRLLPTDATNPSENMVSEQCPPGFMQAIKATDGKVACVYPETREKLILRGWANPS